MDNLEICKEYGWSLSDVKKLSVFERDAVIRHINKMRRKQKQAYRKSRNKKRGR